ncbi:hypothetical protein IE53DRAFT_319523, partial [Violaceomyces palustris]
RANKTITQILRACVDTCQQDWVMKLPFVEYAINNCTKNTTGFPHFDVKHGFNPSIVRLKGNRA